MSNKVSIILIFYITTLSLDSCFITRVDVGSNEYKAGKKDYKIFETYSLIKKEYLFWGLLHLNPHLQPAIPVDSNYTIQTSFDLFDIIVPFFTYGVLGMNTVKISVKPKEIKYLPPNK